MKKFQSKIVKVITAVFILTQGSAVFLIPAAQADGNNEFKQANVKGVSLPGITADESARQGEGDESSIPSDPMASFMSDNPLESVEDSGSGDATDGVTNPQVNNSTVRVLPGGDGADPIVIPPNPENDDVKNETNGTNETAASSPFIEPPTSDEVGTVLGVMVTPSSDSGITGDPFDGNLGVVGDILGIPGSGPNDPVVFNDGPVAVGAVGTGNNNAGGMQVIAAGPVGGVGVLPAGVDNGGEAPRRPLRVGSILNEGVVNELMGGNLACNHQISESDFYKSLTTREFSIK